jgi:hypothetical protein
MKQSHRTLWNGVLYTVSGIVVVGIALVAMTYARTIIQAVIVFGVAVVICFFAAKKFEQL